MTPSVLFRCAAWRAVVATLLLAMPAAGADKAAGPDRGARYRSCMELARGDPNKALDAARTWRGQGGGDAAGCCEASALAGLGRSAEAGKAFEMLARNSAGGPNVRTALLADAAQAWLLAGQPERAAGRLTEALGLTPGDAALWVDKARALADLGRYRDAIGDLSRAIELDPRMTDAFVFRASAFRHLEDLVAAEADLDAALRLDSRHPEGLLERGMVRRLNGDDDGARRDWAMVMTVAPDSAAVRMAEANLAKMDSAPASFD